MNQLPYEDTYIKAWTNQGWCSSTTVYLQSRYRALYVWKCIFEAYLRICNLRLVYLIANDGLYDSYHPGYIVILLLHPVSSCSRYIVMISHFHPPLHHSTNTSDSRMVQVRLQRTDFGDLDTNTYSEYADPETSLEIVRACIDYGMQYLY